MLGTSSRTVDSGTVDSGTVDSGTVQQCVRLRCLWADLSLLSCLQGYVRDYVSWLHTYESLGGLYTTAKWPELD